MVLVGHAEESAVKASCEELRCLGPAAVRLLAECVEHQGVTRKKVSTAARQLESLGFVFIRETGDLWATEYAIAPSLTGEEALEALEGEMEKDLVSRPSRHTASCR